MYRHKWLLAAPPAVAALLIAGSVASQALFRERAFFEGQALEMQIPAVTSHDPNQRPLLHGSRAMDTEEE